MGTDTFNHAQFCVKCGQMRDAKYYYLDRMKTKEMQLAEIRRELEVSNRPHGATIARIKDMKFLINRLLDEIIKDWAEEAHRKMFS